MRTENISEKSDRLINNETVFIYDRTTIVPDTIKKRIQHIHQNLTHNKAQVLFITSYPPRECGIATYSQDLIRALNKKFSNSLSIKTCALENGSEMFNYPPEVKYTLNTSQANSYIDLAQQINKNNQIQYVLIQHEFGFYKDKEQAFLQLLHDIKKPIMIVFHTVLPEPELQLKNQVINIVTACKLVVVMTKTLADILVHDYEISPQKISIIAHGTHLVPHLSEKFLKKKYGLTGKKVLTTFGLLSSGKSIETTLDALPAIIKQCPEVLFLIIGKTHPEVVKNEGEVYRESLKKKVNDLKIGDHVRFINKYLELPVLLEYLQLTDIYLFTTNDPNQAVSGTFVYAMSCGCPIISTPIPHAREVLTKDTGIIFDFKDSSQLADSVNLLLNDYPLRKNIISNTLQKIVSTAWENSAVAYAMLFEKISGNKTKFHYNLPDINLDHLKAMSTGFGIIQFSKINQPDIKSGYTLDDNARALIATCMYYKLSGNNESLSYIRKYLSFINICQQSNGNFLNYVDQDHNFTNQNKEVNLEDSNGRALWALGYVVSLKDVLPKAIISEATRIFLLAMTNLESIKSPRAMAFAIKGLFYFQKTKKSVICKPIPEIFANRLLALYTKESTQEWNWYENYMTYANSILPEALLYVWQITGKDIYKDTAIASFNFLLSIIFNKNGIEVVSNKGWLQKDVEARQFGEQPIDVAYTVMTLSKFYDILTNKEYLEKMEIAFSWFLGNNRLHQIVYNPCTGGCYDGLEETHVNLNQGAESTISYLMARLTIEKYKNEK